MYWCFICGRAHKQSSGIGLKHERYMHTNGPTKLINISIDIEVDECIADEIKSLSDNGILTLECCCGHGREMDFSYIAVHYYYIKRMEKLGYKKLRLHKTRLQVKGNIFDDCGKKVGQKWLHVGLDAGIYKPKSKCDCKPKKLNVKDELAVDTSPPKEEDKEKQQ